MRITRQTCFSSCILLVSSSSTGLESKQHYPTCPCSPCYMQVTPLPGGGGESLMEVDGTTRGPWDFREPSRRGITPVCPGLLSPICLSGYTQQVSRPPGRRVECSYHCTQPVHPSSSMRPDQEHIHNSTLHYFTTHTHTSSSTSWLSLL